MLWSGLSLTPCRAPCSWFTPIPICSSYSGTLSGSCYLSQMFFSSLLQMFKIRQQSTKVSCHAHNGAKYVSNFIAALYRDKHPPSTTSQMLYVSEVNHIQPGACSVLHPGQRGRVTHLRNSPRPSLLHKHSPVEHFSLSHRLTPSSSTPIFLLRSLL